MATLLLCLLTALHVHGGSTGYHMVAVKTCSGKWAMIYADKHFTVPMPNPFVSNKDGSYEFYGIYPFNSRAKIARKSLTFRLTHYMVVLCLIHQRQPASWRTKMASETLNMTGYKTSELAQMVDVDVYAVREEAYKRSDKIRKQLERAKAQVAKLQAEHDQCGYALLAVSRQLASEREV